jgi:hypothetical protein
MALPTDGTFGNASLLTSSGTVKDGSGVLLGFYVASTSSGTIVLRDGVLDTSPAVSGTITPAVGWHAFPAVFSTGIRATLASTINVTFLYK